MRGWLGLVALLCPLCAGAETSPPEARVTLGIAQGYLDEQFPDHWLAGGSVRFYLTGRLAVEPEFSYIKFTHARQFQDFRRYAFVPNLAFDLQDRDERVIPYVIGGVGVEYLRERAGLGENSRTHATVNGGVGVKFFLTTRLFFAAEARAGWGPLLRVTGSLGYCLRD